MIFYTEFHFNTTTLPFNALKQYTWTKWRIVLTKKWAAFVVTWVRFGGSHAHKEWRKSSMVA